MSSASAPPHVYERQNTQGRSVSYTGSDPRSDPHQQHHNQHHAPQHPASAYWASSAVGGGNREARYSSSNSVPPMGYRHRDLSSPDRLGGVVEGHHDDRHLYDRESRGGLRASHGVSEGGGGGRGGMGGHEDSRSIRGSGSGAPGSAGGLTPEQELEIANEMERELRRQVGGQHSGSAGGDGGGAGSRSSSGNGNGVAGRDDVATVSGRVGPGVGRGAVIDTAPAGGGGGSGSRNLSSSIAPSSSVSGSVGGGDPGPMSSSHGSAPVREGGVAARSSMGDERGDGSRRGSVEGGASAVGGVPGAGSVGGSQAGTRGLHPRSAPVPRTMGPVGSDGRGGAVALGPNGSSSGGTGYRSQNPGGDSNAQQHPYWRGQPQDPIRQPSQSHHPSSSHHHQQRRASSPSSAAAVAAAPGGGYPGGAHASQQQPGQHYRQHGHGQPPDRLGAGNSSNSGIGGTGGVFYPGPPRGSGGGSGPGVVNGAAASGSSSGGGGGRVSHVDGLDGNWRVQGGIPGGDGSGSGGGGSQYPAPHGREAGDSRRCPPPPPPPTGVPNSQIQYRDTTPSYPTYRASAPSSAGLPIAVDDNSVGRRAVVDSSPMVAAVSASASAAPPVAVAPSSTSAAAAASPSSVSASHAAIPAAVMPDQQRSVAQRLPPSAAAGMSSAIAQLPHPPPRALPREVDTGSSHMRQGPGVPAGGNSWGPGGVPSRGGVGASSASGSGSGPGHGPVPGMGGGVTGVSHQTPLEMLGAGLDGSYRVIQTAVPLGTRKVALQTLDDLALFFVDMRSTLLVRMASSADVMDELCLRTETFEKALGSPGGMVICAPQFLRPGGAMEEAGMLDGDLITHINGDSVSADPPEQLVWNAKPVKGVRLLDITFLRATGESSTVGYPWHEALAWWQSGVRRHMIESAQPEQRHWMLQASERRCRDAILSYRLFREYSTPTQRTSMSSTSGVQGGSGGPPGNPPAGGVVMHSVGGARHPAGPEPRGNNGGGTGTGSRTSGGTGAGAGTPGGMLNSARGSPAQSSVPSGGRMAATDYSGVGRERDRDRGMASLSSNQRSAGGGGNGSGSGIGGIVNDRRGNGNGNGVGVGAERSGNGNGNEADRSGNGIARSGNGVGGGGGWRSRGGVSGSSPSWPAANAHASSSGGGASVGAEGISGDRVAPPPGTSRKTRGAWEDRDYWGGREFDMRARGRDYGRGRGMEVERDDWAYHHQQQRQQWLDTRPGPKARSPLTVGGRGGNGSRGGSYPSEMDIEARGGGGSRDGYGGIIEGTGRGDRPESSPMEKDPSGRAGYGRPSSPHSIKRGSPGSLSSRMNEEREGNSSAAVASAGDVRSRAIVGMGDRSDERERDDATAVSSSRRRSVDDGSSVVDSEFGYKKHSQDGVGEGGGVGDSAGPVGRSGDGPNYYEVDGDEDGEKRGSWDRNRDLRFGGKGVMESPRRREMLQAPATNRDENTRDIGQGEDDDARDGGRSSGSSASALQQQQQQLKNRWESQDGEMDERRGDGRTEGYRNRRHEFNEEGEGRRALGPGPGRGVESDDVRGGRSGKRAFSSDSPDRGGDPAGDSRGDDDRSKRSKMDRDGDRDGGNDYPALADGAGRRRSSGGGGDVEVVSPVFNRRNGSTTGGLHEKHHQEQQQQRDVGSGFSRGNVGGGGRDGSEIMSSRRWGGDRHRGSDEGEVERVRKDDDHGGDNGWSTSWRRVIMSPSMTSSSREGPGGDGVVSSPSVDPPTSSASGRRGPGVSGRSRSRSKEGDSERRAAAVERCGNAVGHQRRSGAGGGNVGVGDRSTSPAGAMGGDGGQGGAGGDWWGSMRQSCDYCAKKKIKCSGEADRCSRCRKDQIECIYSPKKKTGPIPRKASAAGNDHDDSPGRGPPPSSMELPRSRTRGRDGDDNKERVVEEISETARGEEGGKGGGHGGAISRGVAKAFPEAHRRSSSRSPDSVRAWRDRRGSKNGSLYAGGRRWEDVSRGSSGQTGGRKGSESEREWSSRRGGGDPGQMDEPSTVAPHLMTRGVSPDSTHRIKHVAEEVPANGPRSRRDGNGIGDGKEQKFHGRGNSPESDVDDSSSGGGGGGGGGGGLRGNRARMKQLRSREDSSGVRGDDDSESNIQNFQNKDNKGGASESSGSRRSSSVGVERETVPGGDDALKESGSYSPSANADARGSPAALRKNGVGDAARDGGDAIDSREGKEVRPARGFGGAEGSEDRRSASGRRYRSSGGPIKDEEGAGGGRGNQPEERCESYPEETESNYPEEPERERRRRTGGKKSAAAARSDGDGSGKKWTSGWEKPTGGGSGVDEEADGEVGDKQRLSPEEKLTRAGFDVSTAPLPSTFLPQSSGSSQQRSGKESKRGDRGRSRISPVRASSVDAKSGRSSEDAGAGRENDKSRSSEVGDGGGTASSSSRGGSAERRSKKKSAEIASASGGAFAVGSSKAERELVGMDSEGSSADEVIGPRPSKRMCR